MFEKNLIEWEILNVGDFGCTTAHFSHDGNHIEAPGSVDFTVMKVMVDGKAQILPLLVVDCLQRVGEVPVPSRLNLHKDDTLILLGNNVDVAVLRVPVTLQYDVTLFLQPGNSLFFCRGLSWLFLLERLLKKFFY